MIQYRELTQIFRSLPIPENRPLVLHVSDHSLEKIQGGAKTFLGTAKAVFPRLMMPSFTYQTMVFPSHGPKDNGVEYNNPPLDNQKAVFFHPLLPVSNEVGRAPEIFRKLPDVQRSSHPILSFCGRELDQALQSQSLSKPYAPLSDAAEQEGWVLLIDLDQTSNFSIHYALYKGGRKLFTRWALTSAGVKTCPHFPGCSEGFNQINPHLEKSLISTKKAALTIKAVPLTVLQKVVQRLLSQNPLALLCDKEHCLRCESIRARVESKL